MVPKVAGKGTSFKGAGAYYLHDKEADTSARVAFTHTENLPTDDPEMALRHMAYTAMHQDQLKALAGVKATGRKSAQSVYTYSLSWAPDEEPTREEMIEAGRETLKALGLEGHEALMVAHNDEPHPHLHVIVGRVNPITGIMAPLNKDYLKLSRWAEDYERRQGEIRCEQRPLNNEKRRNGEFVKYHDGFDVAAFHQWREKRARQAGAVWQAKAADLAARQTKQQQTFELAYIKVRQALYDEKEGQIGQIRKQLRQQNRPHWAALFRQQREEWRALNSSQKSAYSRLRYFLRHRGHDIPEGGKAGLKETMQDAMRAVLGTDNPHGALSRKHFAERKQLAKAIGAQRRDATREINERYRKELGRLRTERTRLSRLQRDELRALQERHLQAIKEGAEAAKKGRDLKQFKEETGQSVSREFERRAWEEIRKASRRREEEKKRGRDRDGGRERDR